MSDRETVLHVNNVCWIGGTAYHTLTIAKAYPEYDHVVVFRSSDFDPFMADEFKAIGAKVYAADALNSRLIDNVDPFLVIMNNTYRGYVRLNWTKLLRERVVVAYRHGAAGDVPHTYLVWNSEFSRAEDGKPGEVSRVMGSFIDTDEFDSVERSYEYCRSMGTLTTGATRIKLKLGGSFAAALLRINMRIPSLKVVIPNAEDVGLPTWCDTPNLQHSTVTDFYSSIDIFIYYTDGSNTENWGRTVTEAMAAGLPIVAERRGAIVEQIDDGVDGFLFDTVDELIDRVVELYHDGDLRRRIGTAAREKACSRFGIPAIRSHLDDIFEEAMRRRG